METAGSSDERDDHQEGRAATETYLPGARKTSLLDAIDPVEPSTRNCVITHCVQMSCGETADVVASNSLNDLSAIPQDPDTLWNFLDDFHPCSDYSDLVETLPFEVLVIPTLFL